MKKVVILAMIFISSSAFAVCEEYRFGSPEWYRCMDKYGERDQP